MAALPVLYLVTLREFIEDRIRLAEHAKCCTPSRSFWSKVRESRGLVRIEAKTKREQAGLTFSPCNDTPYPILRLGDQTSAVGGCTSEADMRSRTAVAMFSRV